MTASVCYVRVCGISSLQFFNFFLLSSSLTKQDARRSALVLVIIYPILPRCIPPTCTRTYIYIYMYILLTIPVPLTDELQNVCWLVVSVETRLTNVRVMV